MSSSTSPTRLEPATTDALLAISMGDPCGIGPEIIVKAATQGAAGPHVVVGDVGVLTRAAQALGDAWPVHRVSDLTELGALPPHCIPVWEPPGLPAGLLDLPLGRVAARAGAAAAACIVGAVDLVQRGIARGLVTAPIHKKAFAAAGVNHPGHTEMLQELAARAGQPCEVRMMLANDELRVVLVTVHLALRDAIVAVTRERVLQTLLIAHASAAAWGMAAPRIAVAGLNPHAGEGGLFGDEEVRHIAPAIADARLLSIDASGPFAPDTVFMRARHVAGHAGEFDLVLAMTHDHGLIPVKYLGVEQGVNVTLGLPFVRTSPDHGTAFDLAGSGRADPSSLVAAIAMARRLLP